MKPSFMVEGFEETLNALDQTDARINRGVNNAIKKSASPMEEYIRNNTPKSDTSKWKKSKWKYGEGHAKDNVGTSNIRGKADFKYVRVGYGKDHAWRMWFLERGTYDRHNNEGGSRGISPHRIVEAAEIKTAADAFRIQHEILEKVLR